MNRAIRALPANSRLDGILLKDVGPLSPGLNELVIAGMGGSAFPGDILAALLTDSSTRVTVSRNYTLPNDASVKDALVIVSSFSGRTYESLSSLEDARARGCLTVLVTGDAQLAAREIGNGQAAVCVPTPFEGFQPRAAYGYFFGCIFADCSLGWR